MHYKKNYDSEKKKLYRFKMAAAKWPILFHVISNLAEIWKKKNTFPKESSNEFWLIVREHKYIYLAEIKIKILIRGWFKGQRGKALFRTAKIATLC